ncbi:anti-phage dCTP deaminase [Methylosinus sporium]|uniref:anti-phage dCTP deaminase n=1 Tax=Methylosinus sporium TaxID=428 RepID=UPI00383AC8D7
MATKPATKKLSLQQLDDLFDAQQQIKSSHTSELVIALCGPIGSPLHKVAAAFENILGKEFGYDPCIPLRLSKLIEERQGAAPSTNKYQRAKYLIEKGDLLRKDYGNSILAELAVCKIALERQNYREKNKSSAFKPRRICHIIDSLKNQEELDLLRLVYRDMVYVVGVYSPLPARVKALERNGMKLSEIYDLIDQDSGEEFSHGQTVRETFPQADFFLRIDTDTDSQIKTRVERFLQLILGTKVITPTPGETAMYAAASAAANSACLSRQVGAAITDQNGTVISVGWNDVPKFGGNLYMTDPVNDPHSDRDKRCWNLKGGACFNDHEKENITELLVNELIESSLIGSDNKESAKLKISKNSKIKNLIEFSRSVHAEMHAIISAGQLSKAHLSGLKLYVTTYPCHNCARHIIAAGITEVYYIEPYRKSLATRLHDDSITEEESDTSKVRILPYEGVAPSRYLKLFKIPQSGRKSNGMLIATDPQSSQPRFDKTMEALPTLEAIVLKGLKEKKLIPDSLEDGGGENG